MDTNEPTQPEPADDMPEDTPAQPEIKLEISGQQALDALRHVVNEVGPQHVYQTPAPELGSCVYAWPVNGDLKPQCIIGYALAHLGIPLQLIHDLGNDMNIHGLAVKLSAHGYRLTPAALTIFRTAQYVQDAILVPGTQEPTPEVAERCTWGKALAAAERVAERYPEIT